MSRGTSSWGIDPRPGRAGRRRWDVNRSNPNNAGRWRRETGRGEIIAPAGRGPHGHRQRRPFRVTAFPARLGGTRWGCDKEATVDEYRPRGPGPRRFGDGPPGRPGAPRSPGARRLPADPDPGAVRDAPGRGGAGRGLEL